jgi:SPRY domain
MSGQRYSSRIEEESFRVAILMNLTDGSISFMINGINQGFAFVEPNLIGKTVYPAVALREGSKVTVINSISTFDEIVV